jgi:hypothetical protein
LVEYIPISGSIPSNGKFMDGTTIDSQFYFENIDYVASFRDIVRIINRKILKDVQWKNVIVERRYEQLREIGCSYPLEYLLFDFCLAALEGDYLNAKLYLAHSFHILGLHRAFNLLLSVIVNEPLTEDKDVRELLTLLARATEPPNAGTYLDTYGDGYTKRYKIYLAELEKLK